MSELAGRLAREHELVVHDGFGGPDLDRSIWIPHYLPQWVGRDRSAARYALVDGALHLTIEPDQAPWSPQLEGELRVSSLQTGVFSGPVGSTLGQHGTRPGATVVEQQPTEWLLTPTYGAVELRASWRPQAGRMVALWMIGIEDRPERSAEICVCEIFGRDATDTGVAIGMGLHPFGDPAIVDDFEQVTVGIDVSTAHEYAVVWEPGATSWYVDGDLVKRSAQAPDYPMQLMLNIYDFGDADPCEPCAPFVVEHVRYHARRSEPRA